MMTDKFRVNIPGLWGVPWPDYFNKFYKHCERIAQDNNWGVTTVINHELRPLGGKLITTRTQGWYLRWDAESAHTAFVLKWS